jgi:hypothetical protein
MRPRHILGTAALLAPLLLTACEQQGPIALSPQYTTPPHYRDDLAAAEADGPACRVFIQGVRDLRPDNLSMGSVNRPVLAADSAGWVRSGLQSLGRDRRIVVVSTAAGADLVLDAEILKAYIMAITTQKAANVVIRVRYSHNGIAQGDAIYRGAINDMNWINGDSETQDAFNDALEQVIGAIAADAVVRCKPAP